MISNYQLKGITQTVYCIENDIHTQEPLENPGIAPNVFKTFKKPIRFHVDKQISISGFKSGKKKLNMIM